MTDRDLMQQALDALRQCEFTTPPAQRQIVKNALAALNERLAHCDRCGKKLGGESDIHTCTPKTNQCGETCERAKMCATCAGVLTEFDEAVAAVDATLHHAVDHWQDRALKAEALLAQPEQKPVAWGVFDGPNLHDMFFTEQDAHVMARLKSAKSVVKPLCTTPPQRKPLSDEEIHDCFQQKNRDKVIERRLIARAIEAAHGIKEST